MKQQADTIAQHWRDLDLTQVVYWPTRIRRIFLALLALLSLCLAAWFFIYPLYIHYQATQSQNHLLKQQIVNKLAQQKSLNSTTVASFKKVSSQEQGIWLDSLTRLAQDKGLQSFSVKPYANNVADKQDMWRLAKLGVQSNADNNTVSLPSWVDQGVYSISVSMQGRYENILAWLNEVVAQDVWLPVSQVRLSAADSTAHKDWVRADFVLLYLRDNIKDKP